MKTIELINQLISLTFLLQLLAFIVVLLITSTIQSPLWQLLHNVRQRSDEQVIYKQRLLTVFEHIAFPLIAQILGNLFIAIFDKLDWESDLLDWAVSLLTIWFIYCLMDSIIEVSLPPIQANFWSRSIVLPVTILITILNGLGLLSIILEWSMTIGEMGIKFTVRSAIIGMTIVVISFVVSRGVGQVLKKDILPKAGAQPALAQALSMLASYGVILMGLAIGLSAMGIDLTTFTVILGGLSVGLGFGLQEIVSNLVSGFILMFEQAISPGDVLKVGDVAGEVRDVGIRSITIHTRDNVELIVPNNHFLTQVITSLTRTDKYVRVGVGVGVTYSAKPRQVETALLDAASRHSTALKNPAPSVLFQDFGDSSLNFELFVWTDDAKSISVFASELRYHIWDILEEVGIEIPFPQRDVNVRSMPFQMENQKQES